MHSVFLQMCIPTCSIFQMPSPQENEGESREMSAQVSSASPLTHTESSPFLSSRKGTSLRAELHPQAQLRPKLVELLLCHKQDPGPGREANRAPWDTTRCQEAAPRAVLPAHRPPQLEENLELTVCPRVGLQANRTDGAGVNSTSSQL